LTAGKELVGILGIGPKENLKPYTNKDIEILGEIGMQLGITLQNAVHHGYLVDRERIAGELKLGRDIQLRLLPQKIPRVDGLRLAGLSIPAMEIGGDYYDYFVPPSDGYADAPSDTVSVAIGDVSGKGVGAGLIMSAAKAVLRELHRQDLTPKQVLGRTNNLLMEYTQGEKFMTMLYLEWSNRTQKFRYSSAGHEHIIVYRGGGKVDIILSGGFLLGVRPDIDDLLEDRYLDMRPGDKMVLYTDGITDAMNPEMEFYGMERFSRSIREHGSNKSAADLMEALKNDLFSFMSGQKQSDDITMVILEAV
jgi:sigma-B regulation protein RsbU (phosphoserine phosphatase)